MQVSCYQSVANSVYFQIYVKYLSMHTWLEETSGKSKTALPSLLQAKEWILRALIWSVVSWST